MAHLTFALPTPQVVADLKTMRELAEHLLHFDAVTFLSYLETLRAGEGISSFWLFHDAAHLIFDEVCSHRHKLLIRIEKPQEKRSCRSIDRWVKPSIYSV